MTHIRCPAIGQSTTTSSLPLMLWFIVPLTTVAAMLFCKQLPASATAAEGFQRAGGLSKALATNLNIQSR
ncbi:uncharacterized protein K441DRAFT_192398 [Cenococcum geophilum 1.58]|uniref:uncharacterized protein n=1 Tax=Cenococcum geophilum 1.58 TaxID=794803 RepID=UPI00358F2CC2|nr:hypothetical protein K441DRAFT_192398 [Cenococcum geophilum 1.58]